MKEEEIQSTLKMLNDYIYKILKDGCSLYLENEDAGLNIEYNQVTIDIFHHCKANHL